MNVQMNSNLWREYVFRNWDRKKLLEYANIVLKLCREHFELREKIGNEAELFYDKIGGQQVKITYSFN